MKNDDGEHTASPFEPLAPVVNRNASRDAAQIPPEDVKRLVGRFRHWSAWDSLSPLQRRQAAEQHDSQHDPARRDSNERSFSLAVDLLKIEQMPDHMATEYAAKELLLAQKRQEWSELHQMSAGLEVGKSAPEDRSEPAGVTVLKHSTKSQRENLLSSVIGKAVELAGGPDAASAAVWVQLQDLAGQSNSHPPLRGLAAGGIAYSDGTSTLTLSRKNLADRLRRMRAKAR